MNPSDTAARVNKGFDVGHCEHTAGPWHWIFSPISNERIALVSADGKTDVLLATGNESQAWADVSGANARLIAAAPQLLAEISTLANHPSDEVNRRYIVPLQVAYASAMAEHDRLAAQKAQLLSALVAMSARFERVCLFAYPEHQPESITILLQHARVAIAAATKPSP